MGLQGMINDLMLSGATSPPCIEGWRHARRVAFGSARRVASAASHWRGASLRLSSTLWWRLERPSEPPIEATLPKVPVLGITGTGGAGKSSMVDELVRRFLAGLPRGSASALISVDPSKRKTGGALLGDRIRMNAINIRTGCTCGLWRRGNPTSRALSQARGRRAVDVTASVSGFDLVVLETSGVGQSDHGDHGPQRRGAVRHDAGVRSRPRSSRRVDMLDFADVVAIDEFDKRGGTGRHPRRCAGSNSSATRYPVGRPTTKTCPWWGPSASQFNDPGTNQLFSMVMNLLTERTKVELNVPAAEGDSSSEKQFVIPPKRTRYLSEIAERIGTPTTGPKSRPQRRANCKRCRQHKPWWTKRRDLLKPRHTRCDWRWTRRSWSG